MSLALEQPHVRVYCKGGTFWALPSHAAASVHSAIDRKEKWWSGFDVWQQPVRILVKTITGTIGKTTESMAILKAEDDEEKEREPSWK